MSGCINQIKYISLSIICSIVKPHRRGFDSNAPLRAVFVTAELQPFQDGLPEAASKQDRVDQTLNYLVSRQLSDGRSLLPLFLATLRDRYQEGDALKIELEASYAEVQHSLASHSKQSQETSSEQSNDFRKLENLIKLLAHNYEKAELGEFVQLMNLYISALPMDKMGMSREIVIHAYQQNRLDDLILRIKMDGRIPRPDDTPIRNNSPSEQKRWNTAVLRELLSVAYDDEGLTSLCFDYFHTVYDAFSVGMGKRQKIQRLLEYCVRHDQVEELLSLAKKHNQAQYAQYENRLRGNN